MAGVMIPVGTKERTDLLDCNSLCSPLWWRASAGQVGGRGKQGSDHLEALLRAGMEPRTTSTGIACPAGGQSYPKTMMSRFLNVEKRESR